MFARCLPIACTVAALLLPIALNAQETFQLDDQAGRFLDVKSAAGRTLLRYVYRRDTASPQQDFDTAKVFLHVFAPDGQTTLTQGVGGELYPHHRGIFVGWSRLQHQGQQHNLWGAKNMAQVHRKFLVTRADDQGAVITSVIEWQGKEGQPVLQEQRTHHLQVDDKAHVLLDVKTVLTAVYGSVKLDGDPEHAGLQFRPSPEVAVNKSARYTFHDPQVNPRQDQDLPWVAETFRVADQLWTVQMMRHPENPAGARWSAYRDYGRFGPFTVMEIAAGQQRVLQYRFRITAGDAPPREQLQAYYMRYANSD
jgi:hypothetical protein